MGRGWAEREPPPHGGSDISSQPGLPAPFPCPHRCRSGRLLLNNAPMLMVAWRLMTSGDSGVSVEASRVSASWIDSPSSPTV